jgi:hypothetical protein
MKKNRKWNNIVLRTQIKEEITIIRPALIKDQYGKP